MTSARVSRAGRRVTSRPSVKIKPVIAQTPRVKALGGVLRELGELRRAFDPVSAKRKVELLHVARSFPLRDTTQLLAYHEQLLFMAAYPDSKPLLAGVNQELRRIATRVREIYQSENTTQREALDDSGVAHSHLYCSFGVDAVVWLAERFPGDVDLYWDESGSAGEELDGFLREDLLRVESDAVLHSTLTTRELFRLVGGGKPQGGMRWLLSRFDQRSLAPAIHDHAFEHVAVDTHWTQRSDAASRTFVRFPGARRVFQSRSLVKEVDVRAECRRAVGNPARLSRTSAQAIIDAARATLLTRHRETDPVMYAHEQDVELFVLEGGLEVALFGARPERRRPVETYVGFVAARNKVPVAYGGSWILGGSAEIGVNVFDTFRGGESALIFASIMRVYAQRYRVRNFFVDPYQFGKDNEEGIQSGAFWFYYRLGFRPTTKVLERLASTEWEKISGKREYRTVARILRRLATAPVGIALADDGAPERKIDTASLAVAVCESIGRRYQGDRERALRESFRVVAKALGMPRQKRHPHQIQRAMEELSLVVALIPGVARWSSAERRALNAILLEKGGRSERRYAMAVSRHPRFLDGLRQVADQGHRAAAKATVASVRSGKK